MNKVTIIVEQAADGSYWCYSKESINGIGLNACGSTVKDTKKDLMLCLEEVKALAKEQGKPFPEVSFAYKYDLKSFFDYFKYLNVTEIAKRAKINPSLMRQYVCGIKNAGEKTYNRLSKCIEDIKTELNTASF